MSKWLVRTQLRVLFNLMMTICGFVPHHYFNLGSFFPYQDNLYFLPTLPCLQCSFLSVLINFCLLVLVNSNNLGVFDIWNFTNISPSKKWNKTTVSLWLFEQTAASSVICPTHRKKKTKDWTCFGAAGSVSDTSLVVSLQEYTF